MLPKSIRNKIKNYPSFYRKVWLACYAIPRGETRSYGEIASIIGNPGAARAVGTALSKNPFAPLIPCHRVVRKDGGLGGYSGRGGVRRKKKLLDGERKLNK